MMCVDLTSYPLHSRFDGVTKKSVDTCSLTSNTRCRVVRLRRMVRDCEMMSYDCPFSFEVIPCNMDSSMSC